MNVTPLFSIPVASDKLDDVDHDSILERLKTLNYETVAANNALISSPPDQVMEDNLFSDLKKSLMIYFNGFVYDILKFENISFSINCSWVNLHKTGQFGQPHTHPNSFYTCVYFPHDVLSDQGDLFFHNESIQTFINKVIDPQISEYNLMNSQAWSFTPKKGEIYIFPSHLNHSVGVNENSADRYSVACNFWVNQFTDKRRTKFISI
jgi:uncharacterized protein (TIGR02466 family)